MQLPAELHRNELKKEEILWTMIVIIIIFMHCMTLGNVQELGQSAPQTHSYVGPPKVNYLPTPLLL